jgi:hypothetical protein
MIRTVFEVIASWTLASIPAAWVLGHVLEHLDGAPAAALGTRRHRVAA